MGGTVSGSVELVYDTDFRVTSRTVNGANNVAFSYDNDGLLTGAGSMAIVRSAQNGLMTGTTLGTLTTAVGYNTFGEAGNYDASYSGTSLFMTSYTRDKLGRITTKAETIGGVTDNYAYTYDTAGRLTDVTKNGLNIGHYTFDTNSNRMGYTGQLGSFSGIYDAQDRLTSYGTNTYSYTDNGELSSKVNTSNGDITSYSYDVIGNLMAATMPDGTQVDYVIDARNRRVGKKINGVLTQGFLYGSQLNPIAELDGVGNVVSRFVYGTKGNVPDYMVRGGVTYRIISDHLGSPRIIVDTATGTVAQQLSYDEFGNILSDTNPGFQPFGFAGGLYDQHTKLTRFGARDYDAETGKWTAKDPIGFAGGDTNLYGYVLGDPVNWVDPFGLELEAVNLPGIGDTYLDSSVTPLVQSWITLNNQAGINTIATSVFRTTEHQNSLPEDPNAITPAAAGTSLHEAGFAVDMDFKSSKLTVQQRQTIINNAQSAGLSWGGNFRTPDVVHFFLEVLGGRINRAAYINQAQKTYNQLQVPSCP